MAIQVELKRVELRWGLRRLEHGNSGLYANALCCLDAEWIIVCLKLQRGLFNSGWVERIPQHVKSSWLEKNPSKSFITSHRVHIASTCCCCETTKPNLWKRKGSKNFRVDLISCSCHNERLRIHLACLHRVRRPFYSHFFGHDGNLFLRMCWYAFLEMLVKCGKHPSMKRYQDVCKFSGRVSTMVTRKS